MDGPASDPGDDPAPVQDYALSPALRGRLLGTSLAVAGVALLLVAAVVALTGLPIAVLTTVVLLAVIGLGVLTFLLGRRRYVVRLDDTGYQVRFVRGVGRAQARWIDVEDLTTAVVSGTECVVLRLRDGATSTVPVNLIEGDREVFVQELQRRLDAGHGYRPL